MFRPKHCVKADPKKRWEQPDRIFFGFGACHILAGVFLEMHPSQGFWAEWIAPDFDLPGTQVIVTDGQVAFDYHGYVARDDLLHRYWTAHQVWYPGWSARITRIEFDLLDTAALNARKHLGPDQYFGDPIERAGRFIAARARSRQRQSAQ